jgi:hypothetical protein
MACALSIGIISLAKFFPPDVKMTNLSRLGHDQVVEELVISLPTQRPLIGSWAGCLTLPVFR